jgi:hypothetical protein
MSILSRVVAVVSIAFFFALPMHGAGLATLEGIVRDVNGHPVQGAAIRIQGTDPSKVGIVHTSANGQYSYPALETGTYRVTLEINHQVKASITNVKTTTGQTETLNFDLRKGDAAPSATGRHYVWIPAGQITGSHLGAWVEVDDNSKPLSIGMQERMSWQGNAQARAMQQAADGMPNSR